MKTPAEIVDALIEQMLSEAGAAPSAFVSEIARDVARGVARDIVASGATGLIVARGKAIMCLRCGMVSHNPHDVENRYCGACHAFAEGATP
jgi:hypothetical protein